MADAMRMFAADYETRKAFKPEHLCGEVDQLLQRLSSNADWLKYAVDLRGIERLRGAIRNMGSYDGELRDYYNDYTREMDQLATVLQSDLTDEDAKERLEYAQHIVDELERDLSETLDNMRDSKKQARDVI